MGSTGTVGGAVVALAMDRPDLWPSVVLCYVLAGGAMVAGSKIDIDINATNKGFWLFAVHVFIALIWPFAFLSAASRGDIGKKPDA